MRILEVYTPDLKTHVQYKVLDPQDVETFAANHAHVPKDDYVRLVLERVVPNLKGDVAEALKRLDRNLAAQVLSTIYNGALMLNPGFDVSDWLSLSARIPFAQESDGETTSTMTTKETPAKTHTRPLRVTRAKFRGLEPFLRSKVVGQNEAIDEVVRTLKRSVSGLADGNRPQGVFLFAGASGVGKTELAKRIHEYIYGTKTKMVRIDCGEFQHKHENQKLIGAPPGYVGYEKGGQLTKPLAEVNGQAVVLLDEVEKAHPDIFNTFLRMFDEGIITDAQGEVHSCRSAIIIMTTNLGNRKTVENISAPGMGFGGDLDPDLTKVGFPLRTMVERNANQEIRKSFSPEFLNRIDKIVVFNHLTDDDLREIVHLELELINEKLSKRGMAIRYADAVVEAMIREGVNPIEGARGLSRIRREKIEDLLSDALLEQARWPRGTTFQVVWDPDDEFNVIVRKPDEEKRKSSAA